MDVTISLTPWMFALLAWTIFWKSIAMWKSARNGQIYWFIACLVINTAGLLPLIYLQFFQEDNNKHFSLQKKKTHKKAIKKKRPHL